ncbi:ligase-associated DNA damage response endonuclease PdeM [Salinimonas chungwhensis]|uniref:ligase-associated DNA damage response endonuclease PdeM n=1 Tax=Salinimonas chungwhensis TaxID=265425 RepID=UPI0003762692|nr:ligase-associated DNA damage response endonuclease PdeM [Salinimonas chungwhensis]
MVINNDWLTQRLADARLIPARFGGQTWIFDARGVAWLPDEDLLIVSDLHLEKGSYLGSFGHPLPHLDSRATLDSLATIVDDYHPARLVCLGDSFHDAGALSRMDETDKKSLTTLISAVDEWIWILGNHDPAIPDELPGQRHHRWLLRHIGLCHEPEPSWPDCHYQVIGHYHPKTRFASGRQRVKGRCFALSDTLLMMPAFGQYTGGLWTDDPVMQEVFSGRLSQQFLLSDEKIFPLK